MVWFHAVIQPHKYKDQTQFPYIWLIMVSLQFCTFGVTSNTKDICLLDHCSPGLCANDVGILFVPSLHVNIECETQRALP